VSETPYGPWLVREIESLKQALADAHAAVDSLHEQSHPRDLDRIATLEGVIRRAGKDVHDLGCPGRYFPPHREPSLSRRCTCGADVAAVPP
jgi:hypothetical protein